MKSCLKSPLEIVLEKHCDELSVNESEVEGLGFPGNTHGLRNEGRGKFPPKVLKKGVECVAKKWQPVFPTLIWIPCLSFSGTWQKKKILILRCFLPPWSVTSFQWTKVQAFFPLHTLTEQWQTCKNSSWSRRQATLMKYWDSNEPLITGFSQGQ